ncbi:MAG: GNAT family N-acetyltransferase [Saprospiraceae bacterium]|nr:GNAT family N-acetyltransferase [Saprospiraceae bacterium]
MDTQVNIRKADARDAASICHLVRELAAYEKAESEMWLNVDDYRRYFNEDHFECHVAEVEGNVAGMILFYPTFSTWKGPMLHLEDFIVSSEYRRQGIGTLLMDHFLNIAIQKEVNLVKWEVLDWNKDAIKFYKNYDVIIERGWWNVKQILIDQKGRSSMG